MTECEAARLVLRTIAGMVAIVGVCGVVTCIGVVVQLRRRR